MGNSQGWRRLDLDDRGAFERARARARDIRVARYTAHPDGEQLTQIGRLIDEGRVKIRLAKTFPFAQAVEAERELEAGHIRGKLVLDARMSA